MTASKVLSAKHDSCHHCPYCPWGCHALDCNLFVVVGDDSIYSENSHKEEAIEGWDSSDSAWPLCKFVVSFCWKCMQCQIYDSANSNGWSYFFGKTHLLLIVMDMNFESRPYIPPPNKSYCKCCQYDTDVPFFNGSTWELVNTNLY